MSGVAILNALLTAYAPLTAVVPPARIKAGQLPEAAELPSLLLRTVSQIDRQKLERGSSVRVSERVSVTVRAKSYADQRSIIRLVRLAAAGKTGTIGGFERVTVLTAGLNADQIGPGNSFEQTQDFKTSHDEPA